MKTHVEKGKKNIALVGPSGRGTSTLAMSSALLCPRKVSFDWWYGKLLQVMKSSLCVSQMALLRKSQFVVMTTISTTIAFGNLPWVKRRFVMQAAKIANAHDFIICKPKTVIRLLSWASAPNFLEDKGQRLRIARAGLKNHRIDFDEGPRPWLLSLRSWDKRLCLTLWESHFTGKLTHRISTISTRTRVCDQHGQIVEARYSWEFKIAKMDFIKN